MSMPKLSENIQKIPAAIIDNISVKEAARLMILVIAARSRRACASVISGTSRVDIAERKEDGKNSSGMAIPFRAPKADSESVLECVKSVIALGTSIFSAVCSAEAR